MAFLVQVADGSVENANAYIDVAALRAYALDRGVNLSATSDDDLKVAIIKASDFLDSAYSFTGLPVYTTQGTAWPRSILPLALRGLPPILIKACCSLALRAAQNIALHVDPTVDPSGLAVSSTTKKVGPIETTTAFFAPSGGTSGKLSNRFPDVELMLRRAGLLYSAQGGAISRA
jgi:hypothetical protein